MLSIIHRDPSPKGSKSKHLSVGNDADLMNLMSAPIEVLLALRVVLHLKNFPQGYFAEEVAEEAGVLLE